MVFPSLYYGYSGSSGTLMKCLTVFFKINVTNFNETYFAFNGLKGTGDNANVYIQFLVIYDVFGTNFKSSLI